jgi:hypothetical protein
MGEFFRGLLRKVGCSALVVCALVSPFYCFGLHIASDWQYIPHPERFRPVVRMQFFEAWRAFRVGAACAVLRFRFLDAFP